MSHHFRNYTIPQKLVQNLCNIFQRCYNGYQSSVRFFCEKPFSCQLRVFRLTKPSCNSHCEAN